MTALSPPVRLLRSIVLASALAWLVTVSPAFAQPPQTSDVSHWGVKVSFIPSWKMADQVRELLGGGDEGTELNFEGSEFTIGFVRGSRLGGDWGVSFVRKPYKDGSGETEISEDCFGQALMACRPRTESTLTQNVVLTGVEVHWFMRLVNIKERVQIGLNFAGGIAKTSGEVVSTKTFFQPHPNPNANPNMVTNPLTEFTEVETLPARDELPSQVLVPAHSC